MKEVTVRHTSQLKRVPAMLGVAGLLAAALTGCSLIPGFGGCDPVYESGDSSSVVTAEGSFGVKPKVDFPTPLVTKTPEVTVIDAGDGELVPDGAQVDFNIAIFYGKDGQDLSGDDVTTDRLEAGIDENSLSGALACTHVGDRVAITTSVKDAYGEGAGTSVGLTDDDTLVLVVDVTASYLGKANGFNQLPQDGMPVVVTAVDGTPAIAVDLVTEPTTTRVETVKAGDGAKVDSEDSIVVHMRMWSWPDEGGEPAEVVEYNTWPGHKAYVTTLDDPILPPGVHSAIDGARIGTQLLVVIPPGDDAFPTPPQGVSAERAMIWVIDILGIQK